MNDIAHDVGISKRTLYEFFENKEELLTVSVNNSFEKMRIQIECLEKQQYNALEIILLFYEDFISRPLQCYNNKYYEDIRRYPKAFNSGLQNKANFLKICMKLFERGIQEGIFLKGFNFEIIMLFAEQQLKSLHSATTSTKHSMVEILNTIIVTILRGICTEKGITILNRFIQKQEQQRKETESI